MPVHESYLSRLPLLEGIDSFQQLISDPELDARFRAFMDHDDAAPAPDVATRDTTVDGPHGPVGVRLYGEAGTDGDGAGRPGVVWLHGGAFIMGDLDVPEADRTARELAHHSGAVVVSVDYRLAVGPVSHPVPLDDVVAVVRWLRDEAAALGVDPGRITVGGASAGGNLAAAATLRVRDEDGWTPAALVPVYPVVHPRLPAATPELAALMAEVPRILRFLPEDVDGLNRNYVGGPLSRTDGYAMPALADLTGLCPTLVVTAEYDDLRSSGEAFTAALAVAGVDVRQHCARGVLHGFLNLPAEIEPVGEVLTLLADAVLARTTSQPVTPGGHR